MTRKNAAYFPTPSALPKPGVSPAVALLLCAWLTACAAGQGSGSGEAAFAQMPPRAPAGFRLGEPYVSALGEECRELWPETGPAMGAGAYCLRGEGWTVLPDIYDVSVAATEAGAGAATAGGALRRGFGDRPAPAQAPVVDAR
jgi:hypothetical protein